MRRPRWFAERVEPVPPETEFRVSTLELFFDLVFVFTLTTLTSRLVAAFGGKLPILDSVIHVLLIFGVLWWMYAGYAWLTNSIPPVRPVRRILVLIGMAGFLVVALAIPRAFEGDTEVFAVGYLLLVLVHAGLFLQATGAAARVIPFNLAAAALIGSASLLEAPMSYLPWIGAIVLLWVSPYFVGQKGFILHPTHIVERHGLLVIVALGESVVAIGVGAEGDVGPRVIVAAVLGLALASALWWAYFGGDGPAAAEERLAREEPVQRTRLILAGYFYSHVPMLLGIIAMAAGIEAVLAHPEDPLGLAAAVATAAGSAMFFLGGSMFRRVLAMSHVRMRAAGAALSLASIPVGLWLGMAQIVALVALFTTILTIEHRRDVGGLGTTVEPAG